MDHEMILYLFCSLYRLRQEASCFFYILRNTLIFFFSFKHYELQLEKQEFQNLTYFEGQMNYRITFQITITTR